MNAPTTSEAVKQLFLDAGAGWVLWLLAGLSLVSLAITLERWWLFRKVRGDLEGLAQGFHDHLKVGDFEGARAALEASPAVAARIAASGLWVMDRGPQAAEKAMMSKLALERDALEKNLSFLATLGNNAPFIGLFGTVIGVIEAFEALGSGSTGGSASQMASGAVMSAIAEALVATAVGIAVALPAVAAYNYLERQVQSILSGAEVLSNLVLAYLSEDGKVRQRGPSQ